MRYKLADDIESLVVPIMKQYHNHLFSHGVPVWFLWTDKAPRVRGDECLATARKVSGFAAVTHAFGLAKNAPDSVAYDDDEFIEAIDFFVICLWEYGWLGLSHAQREALIDHELSHCLSYLDEDGNVTIKTRGHDVEEFRAIVSRHGAWMPNIRELVDAVNARQQPQLFDTRETAPDAPRRGDYIEAT